MTDSPPPASDWVLQFVTASTGASDQPPVLPAEVLVSFDIDGTLYDGDPPGPLDVGTLTRAQAMGYVFGTASDRTLSDQARLWARRGIVASFVSHKHHLSQVALRFPARRRVHIGDTEIDEMCARQAGFEFHFVGELPTPGTPGWIL